jgi:ATP synthase protein I
VTGKKKHPVLVVCFVQLALLLPVALVLLFVSRLVAVSALLGGLLYILPNAYFTAYAFRYSGADMESAQRVARAFYRGQSGKLVLTMTGFAVVFLHVRPVNVPALMVTYCFMVVSQWFIAREIAKRN